MLALHLEFEDGTRQQFCAPLPILIGRGTECDLRIKAWRVARQHAILTRRAPGLFIEDMGALAGTAVNGQRVAQYGPLGSDDTIIIGPCRIRMDTAGAGTPNSAATYHATESLPAAHGHAPQHTRARQDNSTPVNTVMSSNPSAETLSETDVQASPCAVGHHERAALRRRLHGELVEALDLRRRDIASMSDDALRSEADTLLGAIINADESIDEIVDRDALLREVVDEAVGLGPLEPLLADATITEIMVNRYDEIFVEVGGRLYRHHGGFSSEQSVLGVIERIVSPLGRRIDESSPMVDARLCDGSRVNAIIPPVALRGASLTIRKFPTVRPGMADLVCMGTMDKHISCFLSACVVQRKNIVVSGGTGSGKTTLLNVLSNCIPSGERVVTIEDAAELQLAHEHLVALEARPQNLEGKGAIPIRELVRNALRMRPDRIVVGECRGAEAFDMLAAMNTGHEGSLTTLHANTPRDALGRLETMILMAGMDLPLAAVREHVSAAIDIIVQQARLSSGVRVITSIVQITGQESGRIQMQELFRFEAGPPAAHVGCGVLPDGMPMGQDALDVAMFNQRVELPPQPAAGRAH